MNSTELLTIRLYNQLLSTHEMKAPHEIFSRLEIGEELAERGVLLDDNHLKLLLSFAELEGLIVNGELNGNRQTFTLLEEWAPRTTEISREEALERLARRFFTSHGPATLQDFAWWSNLTMTDCRQALEMIGSDFTREMINRRECLMRNDIRTPLLGQDSALLLAPFDEFVVSYKDRSEMIDAEHYSKVMTKNGIFSPTIMLNGRIIGSWKKSMKKDAPQITLTFFEKMPKRIVALFQPEIERLEKFYA